MEYEMNRRFRFRRLPPAVLAAAAVLVLAAACQEQAQVPAPAAPVAEAPRPALIPLPARIEPRAGAFTLPAGVPVLIGTAGDGGQETVRFLEGLPGISGMQERADSLPVPDVLLAIDPLAAGEGEEDYTLDVTPQGIRVAARHEAGLFYGGITAWQLLTPMPAGATQRSVPALHIEDHPRLAWRGLMLDVARHYLPPRSIEQLLDWMALHKLNVLHWHLTDDQGWRLEIRRYPKLTAVGAWRTDPDGTRSGGFYTQAQVRALVRYAAARHISIVPELDMPGHAQAAIAAYPQLGSIGKRPPVSPDWGVHPWLLNVDDSTFDFIDNVLGEVLELFPSPYIHVGGDEAIKDQWKASPGVQARMHALGIKDENALQGWFMQRLETWLQAHGRKLVGWDEIVDAGLPADATVMSWRGIAGGIAAARAGHDVVMSPAPTLYFDYLQGGGHDEPPGRLHPLTLAEVYAFDPLPRELDAAQARHIIGMQANLWTEHLATPEQVEHAAFPRLAAMAETAWSPAGTHDWADFQQRLLPMLERYRALGIRYAESAFCVTADRLPDGPGAARLTLSNQLALGEIRYTLDGSDPGPDSSLYQSPLRVELPARLRAAPYVDGHAIASVTRLDVDISTFLTHDSDALQDCSHQLPLRLAGPLRPDGTREVLRVDVTDPCWRWPDAPLDGVKGIAVRVARLPWNFQLGHDNDKVVLHKTHSRYGELEVHGEGCAGPLLASLPLAADTARPAPQVLQASLTPPPGSHELCLYFTRHTPDPLWAIERVQLLQQ
jgi:hexosaminidase